MTIDIRARVFCSAGELISGTISDSYRGETGIIYQRGSCVVKGVNALSTGTRVTFSWRGPQGGNSIQRSLLVIGSSCNPLEGTTTLELGCRFTLYKDFQENKVYSWRGVGDPSMDEEDAKIVTIPLRAQSIALAIINKLGFGGLAGGAGSLSNVFSVAEFDLSAGYVNVLSDLFQSECKLIYHAPGSGSDSIGVLDATGSNGQSVITSDDIIEFQPLSIGPPPTASTIVNYSTRKLKKPDESKVKELNWELQESYGEETEVIVEIPAYNTYTIAGVGSYRATDRSISYTYVPYTKVETEYDKLDRVVKRTTTERTILAAIAPGYIQANGIPLYLDDNDGSFNVKAIAPPTGGKEFTIVTTEVTTYKIPSPSIFPSPPEYSLEYPEGYEEVLKVETTVSEPLIKLIASTNVYRYAGESGVGFRYGDSDSQRFTAAKEIRTQDTIKGAKGQQVVRSFTERFSCRAYTIPGQQALVEAIDRLYEFDELFGENGYAVRVITESKSLEKTGVETQLLTGREIGLEQRPPQGDRTNAEVELKQLSVSLGAETSGSGEGAVGVTGFTMPYAPDDIFSKSAFGYSAIRSDADAKARAYGRAQLALRRGARFGFNVKVPATAYNGQLLSAVSVNASGVAVKGLADGVTYTMDSNGIIVSLDVLGQGTIGGSAGGSSGGFITPSWLPVPSGVTTLPTAPVVTDPRPTKWLGYVETVGTNPQTTLNAAFPGAVSGDGVQDTTTWKVWKYDGTVWVDLGTNVVPTSPPTTVIPLFNERLDLGASVRTGITVQRLPYALARQTALSLLTKTRVNAQKVIVLNVPSTVVGLTALAPEVAIGVAVQVPVSGVAVAATAPDVVISVAMQVPLTSIALTAFAPTQAGADDTVIGVPLSTITLSALVPEGVGADLETFYNSWRLQVYGTDAWVFPDWWAD